MIYIDHTYPNGTNHPIIALILPARDADVLAGWLAAQLNPNNYYEYWISEIIDLINTADPIPPGRMQDPPPTNTQTTHPRA